MVSYPLNNPLHIQLLFSTSTLFFNMQ